MKQDTLRDTWRASLKQILRGGHYIPDSIKQQIYGDTVIYLPAVAGQLVQETKPMDTPMFSEVENEVVAVFNSYGTLQVKFNHELDKQEIAAFQYGVLAAVKGICRAEYFGRCGESWEFDIVIRNGQAKRAFEIRSEVQAYTSEFLGRLAPKAQQTSLF